MSSIQRRLLRAACRIRTGYLAAQQQPRPLELPHDAWRELETAYRLGSEACRRGWEIASRRKRDSFISALDWLESQLRAQRAALDRSAPALPTLRLIYEELTAIEGEFPAVEWAEGELLITTEPVTLEGIKFGPFQIGLQLNRLSDEMPFSVTALEPNPAASCSDTVHPHVNSRKLCAGHGRAAISAALADGRLYDFAVVVNQILHTYGEGSAYVELRDWDGVRCHDCDSTVADEDTCTCSHCDERVCGDCLNSCGSCGDGYCGGCIDRCARCEEFSCSGCLTPCDRCRRYVCSSCREDELCETCREDLEAEDELETSDESADENETPSTEPAV